MPAPHGAQPAILVVSDDAGHRSRLTGALERWFANDYRIVEAESPADLFRLATELQATDTQVALVIARQQMEAEVGTTLLGRIRDLLPTSRRVILSGWEDAGLATAAITRAALVGDIDHVVGWPWSVDDDQFLAAVGNLLADWATEHGRYVEVAQLVAEPDDGDAQLLRDAAVRWAVPIGFHDTSTERGRALAESLPRDTQLPAVVLPDGRVLSRPNLGDVAKAFGANADLSHDYDVAIIGSGPAGLAASVYGVSEGLRTLIIERGALGGQASASPQIRNYLGFPGGVSGADLMVRALQQAWSFGLAMEIGRSVVGLEVADGRAVIELDDGSKARARSVVLAMGVTYRKMGIPSVEELFGRGVFYGSGATEAPGVAGEDVFVVGGGNSGAEAAVNLARYARTATLLVRGDSLDGVSDYLVQQLRARPNIRIQLGTEVAEARGTARLESLVLRNRSDGSDAEHPAFALFILIGATPRTDWLPSAIERDPRGFVLTGKDAFRPADGLETTLGTSVPGIYAAGDVRHGSMKRVAAAVGEGATAIREIHEYLAAIGGSRQAAPA